MTDFLVCYNWMMDNEDSQRKYATVPDAPPGAQAISGINSAAYPSEFASINALPQNQRGPAVQNFYQVRFWNQWYDQLVMNDIAKRVFDCAVNNGPGTAVKLLQSAANFVGCGIVVDGVWGPATVNATNGCGISQIVPAFQQARISRYKAIVQANPSNQKYLAQWIARAEK
jgi:lysozyme family protein